VLSAVVCNGTAALNVETCLGLLGTLHCMWERCIAYKNLSGLVKNVACELGIDLIHREHAWPRGTWSLVCKLGTNVCYYVGNV
jgi:hypothetical protein